jgi:hypothetical protein
VIPPLFPSPGSLVDRIKVNTTSKVQREGRTLWIKSRRRSALPILGCANLFFRAAGSPLRTILRKAAWQRWEIHSFSLLHHPEYHAFSWGNSGVAADELPGINLTVPLDEGSLQPAMTAAAGRELRRSHTCRCPIFGDFWSHGDPHLGNFLYDAATDRARLIDFEGMHLQSLSADARHAEDVCAFLEDLAGRAREDLWLPTARAFLEGYDAPQILQQIAPLLVTAPRGKFARLWRGVRTGFMPAAQLHARFQLLVEASTPSGHPKTSSSSPP